MEKEGRIILITGDGKGKTTAALGMALRGAGHGKKTIMIQFVKSDRMTGEIAGAAYLPGFEIVPAGCGFIPERTAPEFECHREAAGKALKLAAEAMASGTYDMVILDEVAYATARGLLDEEQVLNAIRRAGPGTNVVMTGRGAPRGLIDIADTVSEIRAVKHAFQTGRPARRGIEY
jgi:cob(I)alamin adenosyltransferase